MLSRLKGIETLLLAEANREGVAFGYAFPFEGNWNLVGLFFRFRYQTIPPTVWICFPVWRELKLRPPTAEHVDNPSLDMLSRLKGIETKNPFSIPPKVFLSKFGYAFPFEGNWNIFVQTISFSCPFCLDMLSRLKGIETFWIFGVRYINRVWICFPVWRELKPMRLTTWNDLLKKGLDMLSRLKGIETWSADSWAIQRSVWICFPVWRELKQFLFKCQHYFLHSLDMLSRLKGIETLIPRPRGDADSCVWICFPVWRELKRYAVGRCPRRNTP